MKDITALEERGYQEMYQQPPLSELGLSRAPEVVLGEARKAAQALQEVLHGKKNPVKFNGEQYLEFEDWQTVGRFYGITAKIVSTQYVQFGEVSGFEARAEAVMVSSGQVISAADAMCLNDEKNWSSKPMFQLRSMAQTRACAKSLRNVLAWVVVLAGYKPTPAEEMQNMETAGQKAASPVKYDHESPLTQKGQEYQTRTDLISDAQRKRFYAISKTAKIPTEIVKAKLREYNMESSVDITRDLYEEICTWAQNWTA